MNTKQIGAYLLQKRKEKGITQAELAQVFGVTYQAVSRWENGDSIPDVETLLMIADYYGITVDDILQHKTVEPNTDKWDDPVFQQKLYKSLISIFFILANILGFGLGLLFLSFNTDLGTIAGIVTLLFFIPGAHLSLNLYFWLMMDKTKSTILLYTNLYRFFRVGLYFILFTITYLGGWYMYQLMFVLCNILFIGYQIWLQKKYHILKSYKELLHRKWTYFQIFTLMIIVLKLVPYAGLPTIIYIFLALL